MVLNFGEKDEEEEPADSKWQPGISSGNSTPHNQNLVGKDINFNNSTNTYLNSA